MAGQNAQRFARPIAELVGVAADDWVVRYGTMALTFLSLGAAAYLFGPTALPQALATLGLSFALVFFILYWWFSEESRKRRVMLMKEAPLKGDARNPDLRDEAIFACVMLFLITAMSLQTINDVALHYQVSADVLGIKKLACANAASESFCAKNTRLFELPAWLFFTLDSFITAVPMADQVSDYAVKATGVVPTADTPQFVTPGLRILLGGLFLTFFVGFFQKVGRQIDGAIEALHWSHQPAAGLGPIVLGKLDAVLKDEGQKKCWQNAILAVASIAENYKDARATIEKMFMNDLMNRFASVARTRDPEALQQMFNVAQVFCALRSHEGFKLLRGRISQTGSEAAYVTTKRSLIEVIASKLPSTEATEQINRISADTVGKQLTAHIKATLDRLAPSQSPDDEDTTAPEPSAKAP